MKFANLTPHEVIVHTSDDVSEKVVCYAKAGDMARTSSEPQAFLGTVDDDVQVWLPQRPNGITIKPKDPDVDAIIVSFMAAEYLQKQHTDEFNLETTLDGERDVRVFIPDTGPDSCVRDDKDKGRIIGVRRLNEYEPLAAEVIRAARTKRAKTQ